MTTILNEKIFQQFSLFDVKYTEKDQNWDKLLLFLQNIRNECVQVVVRCRPLSNKEETGNFQRVVEVFPSRGVIEVINPSEPIKDNRKMFTYDAVYDWKWVELNLGPEMKNEIFLEVNSLGTTGFFRT